MTQLLPPKKDVALALLERSNVDVHLDPRAKGVVVPPQFRKEPRLVLKIGLNMPVAIPDLRLDDESMSCTLSFSRSPFYCVVPWPSVFAMVGEDGRGMVWPDDVPQELAERVNDRRAPAESSPDDPSSSATASGRAKAKARVLVTEDAAADRSGRAKRAKKKKGGDERPMLVAVPTGDRASGERVERGPRALREVGEESEEKRADEKKGTDERKADGKRPSIGPVAVTGAPPASPARSQGASSSGRPTSRPKRELPPYLRVVK